MTGMIFDVNEFSLHDGPGARTTVFFKGCPLRCLWCHNPEGLAREQQLMVIESRCRHCGLCLRRCAHEECKPFGRCLHACPEHLVRLAGYEITADALAERILKNIDFLVACSGGVTLSGGEPLMQPEFAVELLEKLSGVHKAMETCGYAQPEVFQEVVRHLDYVMLDIKLIDDAEHILQTGVSNRMILQNFRWLQKSGIAYIVRTPLIPGITDTETNLRGITELIGDAPWEKLPYNSMASLKYPQIGIPFTLQGKQDSVQASSQFRSTPPMN
jgi:pyruvate formate lyase activating enzyme